MAPFPVASTSSSSMVTASSRPLTPSGDSEFVRALHDFVPSAESTCLAFEAGQVIRTLNKDESGWWDGELNGKRGWFPSNYVEVLLPGWRESDDSAMGGKPTTGRDVSIVSFLGQTGLLGRNGILEVGRGAEALLTSLHYFVRYRIRYDQSSESRGSPEPSTSFFAHPSDSEGGVLESIQQAIKLLQNAVQTNRISHFQPSTACVISSVRTVLSSTDCLTRESKVLKRHPSLVSERKRILGSLSSLVNQARRASSPTASIEERVEDTDRMLALATTVQENVLTFLSVAARSGVRLAEVDQGTVGGGATAIFEGEFGSGKGNAVRNGKKPELRAARSMSDLKSRRPILQVAPHASTMPSSRGPQSATFREQFPTSATSSSSSAGASSSNGPPTPGKHQPLVLHSTDELLRVLSSIHDQLLSTIAAFIGHVHAHTRSSHSASFAHLIDMTRETIEKVREVLVVVEAVSSHPMLLHGRSSDLDVLRGCKEALYVATTALVTAARLATSAPALDTPKGEDDERRSLLHSATAVLRSGGDCVGAVKLCIAQHNVTSSGPFELVLPDLDGPSVASADEPKIVSHEYHHADEVEGEADFDEPEVTVVGERKHTLSMLGRKATSLSCLREKYEADAGITSVKEEQESNQEEIEERLKDSVANPVRSGTIQARKGSASSGSASGTVTSTRSSPIQSRSQIHSRTSSRASSRAESRGVASVPMSRGESSRTSESATSSRSGLSRTSTNDTSPRSSFNNNDPLKAAKVPLTIPIPPRLSNESTHSQSPSSRAPPSSARLSFASTKESEHWYLSRDYEAREISFNGDGHVTGGTLRCLIERMTLHDTTIDPAFSNTFFLTFRMFTTPTELSEALYERFALVPPTDKPLTPAELKTWTDSKASPIRLRIYNFFKTWIENFWQAETDEVILSSLQVFCRERLAATMANAAQRLIDLIHKRIQTTIAAESANAGRPRAALNRAKSSERLRSGKVVAVGADPYLAPSPTGPPPPPPIVSKALITALRNNAMHLNVLEIDPLELARQITIMESRLYNKIRADELLGQEFSKKGSSAVNVRAMSTLSTRLTGWIAEIILNEQDAKKRTTLVKYFIKLSDRCLTLHNYNALMAILCALNSSTIARLKKTWEGLPTKYRILLDSLRKATEHSRNYAEYRANIRSAVPPCLPFVGLFLTDITFCAEGNPAERPSPVEPTLRLINFDRYQVSRNYVAGEGGTDDLTPPSPAPTQKMSRIISDLQRFQVPYNLLEVSEIQSFLRESLNGLQHGGDVTSLYRQSLMVEPRTDLGGYNPRSTELFNWKS